MEVAAGGCRWPENRVMSRKGGNTNRLLENFGLGIFRFFCRESVAGIPRRGEGAPTLSLGQ